MKPKNICDESVMQEVVERISRLNTASEKKWGIMTVEEMMHHCMLVVNRVMEARPTDAKSTIKQKAIKFYFMNFAKRFPKNVRAPKPIDMKDKKDEVKAIDIERQQLIHSLKQFQKSMVLHAVHPYFGKLNTKEWGIFTYKHLNHHLQQFGV
jgi:hypothetical protein